ncbi:MFS transporter [Blastococcus litoris]|uniref:MFS transporter n=1 Tax=Blastococcus litoris TaxID=2171622 RepID=UPI000E2FFD06|nr:MFS transporter [Blastococcus litoris]
MPTLPRALSPLRHPHYRRLATSLALSLLSSGLWTVGVVWQVVALDGGPAALSLVTALAAVGTLTSTLLGGALADRLPQRHLLLGVALTLATPTAVVAVLSLAGSLALWHLALVSLVGGCAMGLYYPAYSAFVPLLVPTDELLAANGLEGVLRPVLSQGAGPALAGLLVASLHPGAALGAAALAAFAAAATVAALPVTAPREADGTPTGLLADVREGFRYMVGTPWLLATLLFASATVLAFMGPLQVLVPFAIKDGGGGPYQHAFVVAAFGAGGAVGSLVVGSLRLPRRYLTTTNLLWGLGCVPLAVFGFSTPLWPKLAAGLVMGAAFSAAAVIWGTLLQRRVPTAMLGRISSLDFFVSLSFMPVSMALAGPVSEHIGLRTTFLVAALAPSVVAVVAIAAWHLRSDEIAHPLDVVPAPGRLDRV